MQKLNFGALALFIIFTALVLLIFITMPFAHAGTSLVFGGGSGDERVTAVDGLVMVDTARLAPGTVRHFTFREGDTAIRFFVLRDNQGEIRAALNACEVCWQHGKGYVLRGGQMVCVQCNMRFALNRIGQLRGGCNPHPIEFTIQGSWLVVTSAELLNGARFFPGNR
jgi:uncharacterized membrane protein